MQQRSPDNAILLDLSHWQGAINWDQLTKYRFPDGRRVSGAILKASEGNSTVDDKVYANYSELKSRGLAIGVYHFLRATNEADAIAEANFFSSILDALGGIHGIDIEPVLDIEYDSKTLMSMTTEQVAKVSKAWLNVIEKKYGVKPIIYSYTWALDNRLDESLSEYPLWLANYGDTYTQDRAGWKEWKMLQFTDRGQVSGIAGYVDINEYSESEDDLMNRISVEDANKLIDRFVSHGYEFASPADQAERHRLANELRKASGQPVQ